MAILRVRDNNGNITDIPAIKGDKGEPGPQGLQGIQGLQGEKGDKGDKGDSAVTDQTYDPKSENAQSGKAVNEAIKSSIDLSFDSDSDNAQSGYAVKEAIYMNSSMKYDPTDPFPQSGIAVAEALATVSGGGVSWKKIAEINTTEEVNGIVVTAEEFPDIAKCREFIARAVFPKSPTGSNISLGSCRVDFDNKSTLGYYFSNVTINASTDVEARCHITIADRLVFTIGTQSAHGPSAVIANANTMIGNRFLSGDIEDIMFYVNSNDTSLVFPIGTRFLIYGKVKN